MWVWVLGCVYNYLRKFLYIAIVEALQGVTSLEGAQVLTHGVHRVSEGVSLVYRVSVDCPSDMSPTLLAIAAEVCHLAERLYKVTNYRLRLVQIARRHGVYPVSVSGQGYQLHRFTDGAASVTLYVAYRKRRGSV